MELHKQIASIFIEPTNDCNLNCKYCCNSAGFIKKRSPIYLDYNLFKNISVQLPGIGVKKVFLWGFGEPFLYNNYLDMCKVLKELNLEIHSNTNGHYMVNEEEIIKSGISRIIFSIDGASSSTYLQYRKGGDFNLVMANLIKLIEAKHRLNASTEIIWQFIVFPWNESEVEIVRAKAIELQIECIIKTNLGINDIPNNKKYIRAVDQNGNVQISEGQFVDISKMCKQPIIYADGRIGMCLYDSLGEIILGDLNKQSLVDAFYSERWQNYWALQQSDSIQLCKMKCSYWYKVKNTD